MTSRRRYLGVSLGILTILVLAGWKLSSPPSPEPSSPEILTSGSSLQSRESSAAGILTRLNAAGSLKFEAGWQIDDLKKWGVIDLYTDEPWAVCAVIVFDDVESAQRAIDEKVNVWEAAGSSGEWVGKDSVSDLGIIFIAENLDAACSQSVIKALNWKQTSERGFD